MISAGEGVVGIGADDVEGAGEGVGEDAAGVAYALSRPGDDDFTVGEGGNGGLAQGASGIVVDFGFGADCCTSAVIELAVNAKATTVLILGYPSDDEAVVTEGRDR